MTERLQLGNYPRYVQLSRAERKPLVERKETLCSFVGRFPPANQLVSA
jgi:hypothetical protein